MNAADTALLGSVAGLLYVLWKYKSAAASNKFLSGILPLAQSTPLPNYPGVSPCFLRAIQQARDPTAFVFPNVTEGPAMDPHELAELTALVTRRIQAAAPAQTLDLVATTVRDSSKAKDAKGNANVFVTFVVYDRVSNAAVELDAALAVARTGDVGIVTLGLHTGQVPREPCHPTVKAARTTENRDYASYKPVLGAG